MPDRKTVERDVEKSYASKQFVMKLRRLAHCIERGRGFRIQVAGERVLIPPTAAITIEHERNEYGEEIEFQLSWPSQPPPRATAVQKRRIQHP